MRVMRIQGMWGCAACGHALYFPGHQLPEKMVKQGFAVVECHNPNCVHSGCGPFELPVTSIRLKKHEIHGS